MRNLIFLFLAFFCSVAMLIGQEVTMEKTTYPTASGEEVIAESGTLSVLENRANPASKTIDIPFIRLKSTAKTPNVPVVYLEGGPGSSCTWMATNPRRLEAWLPVLAVSDVILIDQRGTGAAGRRLTFINELPLSENLMVTEAAAQAHFVAIAKRAFFAWENSGIDLAGYNTRESAKDLDVLRQALELEKISLLGFSYGTHLGQAYLKYYGEHVERAIFAGVEGLDETYKTPLTMDAHFRKIAAMVAADPTVGQEIPDLVALYQTVATKLSNDPITLSLQNPLTGDNMDVKVGKFGLDFILFMDLGDASDIPMLPRMLYQMNEGDYTAFQWFVQKRISMGYGLHAMAVTMDISSGGSAGRRAVIEEQATQSLFGNVVNTPYLALADIWPTEKLGDDYRAGFTSSVPALLLSGTLDRNTPPQQAERLRWSLPNAQHIVVQNAGHEQILPHPAVGEAIVKFLRGEDVHDITATYPPLKFLPVRGEVIDEDAWHPALGE